MREEMSIVDQVKLNRGEYTKGNKSDKVIKLSIELKEVKTKELVDELMQLREAFMDWDDQRRKKVDLILNVMEMDAEYVDYDTTRSRLIETAKDEELLPASLKMFHLHYTDLSMSESRRKYMDERYERAQRKMNEFKREGRLKK